MSGMYNMVFGLHPLATGLVDLVLGIDITTIPRFRDCYPVKYGDEETKIELVTRAGGMNSVEYATAIETLEKHERYLGWQDDPFDSTYRVFWFSLPTEEENEHIKRLNALMEKHPEATVTKPLGDRWQEAIAALEKGGADGNAAL